MYCAAVFVLCVELRVFGGVCCASDVVWYVVCVLCRMPCMTCDI